jgi:nodulation protein A
MRQPPVSMRCELKRADSLDEAERAALRALTAAVYPPDVVAASPGRHVTWASPQESVLLFAADGSLVSHVGLLVRAARLDGAPVVIGGIGSVKTHPAAEGRGYASAGMRRATAALIEDHAVDFCLLVCREHLLPFYGRLGWHRFDGDLRVEQPSGPMRFTVNEVMVLSGRRQAPVSGVIDLLGPPW